MYPTTATQWVLRKNERGKRPVSRSRTQSHNKTSSKGDVIVKAQDILYSRRIKTGSRGAVGAQSTAKRHQGDATRGCGDKN